jgi:hypothetical protein
VREQARAYFLLKRGQQLRDPSPYIILDALLRRYGSGYTVQDWREEDFETVAGLMAVMAGELDAAEILALERQT